MTMQYEGEDEPRDPTEDNYAEIFQSTADEQWYFAIRSKGNNEIVAQGEGYTEKSSATERVQALFPGIEVRDGRPKKVENRGTSAGDLPTAEEAGLPSAADRRRTPPQASEQAADPKKNPNLDGQGRPIYGKPDVSRGDE